MERYGLTLAAFLGMLPYVLVWLIGLVLSLVHWQRRPKASRLTLIAVAGVGIWNKGKKSQGV